jgi:hypothetical protein
MNVSSYIFREGKFEKSDKLNVTTDENAHLVLGFGAKHLITNQKIYELIVSKFKNAELLLCSTAGEIFGSEVFDDSIVLTAISFEKTDIQTAWVNISDYHSSEEAGIALAKKLNKQGLNNIFVLSDGSKVNGSELVRGIEKTIEHTVPVTGGMAGDGVKFESTAVGLNKLPEAGIIAAVGFYGEHLFVSHGSMCGFEVFGLERTVTKSDSNILYEIDGKNALELYKNYLGKYADDLPGSALLFPLSVQLPDGKDIIVRTILSVNNENNSMIFAGDVPVGSKVRFMRSNFDNIIDAAGEAAQNCLSEFKHKNAKLAVLISCVGRKMILHKRVDEEVEAVMNELSKDVVNIGFYSYGEISPLHIKSSCQLHNQTMTITTFDEV